MNIKKDRTYDLKIDIKKDRIPDLQQVFDQRWKANNYNQNGIKEKIEHRDDQLKKMFNAKPKDTWNKEILQANSVNGKVKNLQDSINSLKAFNQKKFK